jgi:mono/diheme cytochrome c family protein
MMFARIAAAVVALVGAVAVPVAVPLTVSVPASVSALRQKIQTPEEQAKQVQRGHDLVWSIGCNDCHTPKVMGPNGPELDTTRLLSGHRESPVMPAPPALGQGPWGIVTNMELTAWSGPWGITYARNLTPDENTGMGIWTEEMFLKALRTGRHMGVSRPIQPPMPWQVYGRLPDEDLKAIYAYLRSIPPVHNRVPEPQLREDGAETADNQGR